MKIVTSLSNIRNPIKKSVVTIGVFDGVHIGHQAIIKEVVARARAVKAKSILITFDPHPLKIIKPGERVPTLISLAHRARLAKAMGINKVFVVKFSRALANMSAEDFIKMLVRKLGVRDIYVGENFYLGKGASSGPRELQRIAKGHSFKVHVVKSVKVGGETVSSSRIRTLIAKGDIGKAARFLGRKVSVLGTVVSGAALARELGYPTANINPHHEAIPPSGVYAVKIRCGKDIYNGVLNIGTRPTFYGRDTEPEPVIEAHIFNFRKNIYGRDLEVFFVKKLRDEKKFRSTEALVSQIRLDEKRARSI